MLSGRCLSAEVEASTQEHEVLEVIFSGNWKIVLEDREFGPYSSEEEAIQTAQIWAANAGKQGHSVSVVIHGGRADPRIAMR
jgi:hypothetical protein